ncbi:MAG: NB-ARC domain-containing protein [Chloroflexota bacterium]
MACTPEAAPSSFTDRTRQALKEWHSTDQENNTLANLYLFRKVQREEKLMPRQVTNIVLRNGIASMHQSYGKEAELLEARFMDSLSIQNLANKHNVAESTVYAMQRTAIDRLANILEHEEEQASAAQKTLLHQRIEAASYENLIGVESLLQSLLPKIMATEPPWFISLEGIGGIGKTSVAHKLLTIIIDQGIFDEIGWVSARQRHLNLGGGMDEVPEPALTSEALVEKLVEQLLPEYQASELTMEQQLRMLQTLLKDTPHLIVIDNLETLVDVETLLPTLQKLTNPSRFILTSRASLYARTTVFHFAIPELNEEDSLALIRQEARMSNLSELAESSDEEIQPIFGLVGGNPLALRLVVGQNHIYPLDKILEDISTARSDSSQNLYRYIYENAWHSLDSLSQKALMMMPLGNPSGDDIDFLAEVGELSVGDIRMGLNHLVRLNLVDARGGLNERRYSIHSLTRSFLHERVLGWMRDVSGQEDGEEGGGKNRSV